MIGGWTRPNPRWLAACVLALVGGCAAPKTSDSDLVFLTPTEADEALRGGRTLLGGRKSAAMVDPRGNPNGYRVERLETERRSDGISRLAKECLHRFRHFAELIRIMKNE